MSISSAIRPVESWSRLDPLNDVLAKWLKRRLDGRALGGLLRGRWLGHPVHPVLVTVPIGAWTGSVALDALGESSAARRIIGVGLASIPPVIATGWADWSTLDREQRRVGYVHASSNAVAVGLMTASYLRRRHGPDRAARVLSLLGLTATGVGGAIGGYLVYNQAARVETHVEQDTPLADPAYRSGQLPS